MMGSTVVSLPVKSIAIFFVLSFWYSHACAQEIAVASDSSLTAYASMETLITQTKKKNKGVLLLEVQWMDTLFQLERKYEDFIKAVPVPKESNSYYEVYQEAPWDGDGFVVPHANCHGFGLYQSFRHEGIDAEAWFSPTTYVDPSALEVLLHTAYQKIDRLDATTMKDLKKAQAPGSLLIFRDKKGVAIHTAFLGEEGIYSKNGRFEPRIYHKLEHLKMVYYKALTIDVYHMETDRVREYLEGHSMQALLEE